MAPRTRARGTRSNKLQRQPTQFEELDTTPTSGHLLSEAGTSDDNSPAILSEGKDESDYLDHESEDIDLGLLESLDPGLPSQSKSFLWSEPGSVTRRSSPVHPGETPKSIWQFSEKNSTSPMSTGKAGAGRLTDAVLPAEAQADGRRPLHRHGQIDFSETASTVRRSSPFGLGDEMEIWDFQKSPTSMSMAAFSTMAVDDDNLPDTMPVLPTVSSPLFPQPEPRGTAPHAEISIQQRENGIGLDSGISRSNLRPATLAEGKGSSPIDGGRAKRPKQRAKPPVEFHELTLEVKKPVPANSKASKKRPRKEVDSSSSPHEHPRRRVKTKQKSTPAPGNAKANAKKAGSKNVSRKRVTPKKKKQSKTSPNVELSNGDRNAGRSLPPPRQPDKSMELKTQKVEDSESSAQENPDEIMIISSDAGEDSEFQLMPSSSPEIAESCYAEQAWEKTLADPIVLARDEPLRDQDEAQEIVDIPDVREESPIKQVTIDSEIKPKNLSQAPPKDQEPAPKRKNLKQILGERDPNIASKRPVCPGNEVEVIPAPCETKTAYQEQTTGQTQPQLLGKRLVRQFSVSEQGSPLPAKKQAVAQMASYGVEKPDDIEGADLSARKLFARAPDSGSLLKSSDLPKMGSHRKSMADLEIGALAKRLRDEVEHGRRMTVPQGLHEQVLASFATERTRAEGGDESLSGGQYGVQKEPIVQPLVRQRGDGMSDQLHRIVDLLSMQLTSRKSPVYKISDVYRTSGMRSVERIQNRCLKEERSLRAAYHQDEARFEQTAQLAKRTVGASNEMGETSVNALEDSLARRRVLYEDVSSSLRALRGHILGGQAVQFGEAAKM